MRLTTLLFVLVFLIGQTVAQDSPLSANDTRIENQIDVFGQEEQLLVGTLTNEGETAFVGITIYADIYDADDTVIGEAFGYLVDQCGEALLDVPLAVGESRAFALSIDLFEEGEIARFDVIAEGTETEIAETEMPTISPAVQQVSDEEVVAVEWLEDGTLRYGVGCDHRVFTSYGWTDYQPSTGQSAFLGEHPNSIYLTDAFYRQTGINILTQSQEEDLSLFDRSFLTFPTQTSRIVYQTDIHTVITSERDGSFKRVIHQLLHQYSLQGFVWSSAGNFVAYYFGADGEEVRYFTASASGGLISALLPNSVPSVIVPGLTDDGRRVIIGGTFDDENGDETTGYWLQSVVAPQRELLLEVTELPGNNYPAPAYFRKDDDTRYIYLVRPIDGQATLQCLHRETGDLYNFTQLPLNLQSGERAWSWLSPDGTTLAISANGIHGGLWLVDLTAFEGCQ